MSPKKFLIAFVVLVLVAIGIGAIKHSANATGGTSETGGTNNSSDCVPTEDVYATEWQYVKHTRTKYKEDGVWGEFGPWTVWGDGTSHETWSEEKVEALTEPAFHGKGKNWYREWQLRNTGKTRTGDRLIEEGRDCPEKPEPLQETRTDEKADCEEGLFERHQVWTQDYVWDAESWTYVLGEEVLTEDSGWVFVRELTDEEKAELECDEDNPEEPTVGPATRSESECISKTEVKTTHFEWQNGGWVNVGADFRPAKPSDNCGVDEKGQKITHEQASVIYANEEGL